MENACTARTKVRDCAKNSTFPVQDDSQPTRRIQILLVSPTSSGDNVLHRVSKKGFGGSSARWKSGSRLRTTW